ncbi:MAG: hypothetical protein JWQ81_7113 [Amycolatopsis sp.]|nr:hypothetical protein [Amycolatopsis sp.]
MSTTPDLSATLVSPVDIMLKWQDDDPAAAGHTVEFATGTPGSEYTVLQYVQAGQTMYTHPDLIPQTPFYYRLRPFYGPASAAVEVDLPPGAYDDKAAADDHAWAQPLPVPSGSVAKQPIRGAGRSTAGAPTEFTATVMDPNGIKFTWTDHASDEDGYLLESKPKGSATYNEVEVLDPNITSVGLTTLPTEKQATYRVRAFYYGKPSNIAHQTTGDAPPGT